MTTTESGASRGRTGGRRVSPDQVRSTAFGRAPRGRRGLAEDEVAAFAHRVAEELADRESEIATLADENRRLKGALRDWQQDQAAELDPHEPAWVRRAAVTLMARAQQQIDAKIAETELYCRNREQQAHQHYDGVLRQAQHQAREESERAARMYRASSGANYSPDQERARRQQVYLTALLRALDALRAHVDATREAFVGEIENLVPDHVLAVSPEDAPDTAVGQ